MRPFNIFNNFLAHICILWLVTFKFSAADPLTLIENICVRSINQVYCSRLLRSDPRTRNVGPPRLAEVVIDMGYRKAIATKANIEEDIRRTEANKDHSMRSVYCLGMYNYMIEHLKSAPFSVKERLPQVLNNEAGQVRESALNCEHTFDNTPAKSSPFKTDNYYLQIIGNILQITAIGYMV